MSHSSLLVLEDKALQNSYWNIASEKSNLIEAHSLTCFTFLQPYTSMPLALLSSPGLSRVCEVVSGWLSNVGASLLLLVWRWRCLLSDQQPIWKVICSDVPAPFCQETVLSQLSGCHPSRTSPVSWPQPCPAWLPAAGSLSESISICWLEFSLFSAVLCPFTSLYFLPGLCSLSSSFWFRYTASGNAADGQTPLVSKLMALRWQPLARRQPLGSDGLDLGSPLLSIHNLVTVAAAWVFPNLGVWFLASSWNLRTSGR